MGGGQLSILFYSKFTGYFIVRRLLSYSESEIEDARQHRQEPSSQE